MNNEHELQGSIHNPTFKNLKQIIQIEKESFSDPWKEEKFTSLIDHKGFFVYEENGIVLGFIITKKNNIGKIGVLSPISETEENLEFLHVINLAVSPERRREGIGSRLLRRSEKLCRKEGIEAIGLEVRVDNIPAYYLYRRNGFSKIYIIPSYYKNGDSAFLMKKTVSL